MRKAGRTDRLIVSLATAAILVSLVVPAYALKPIATLELSSVDDVVAGVNNVCQAMEIPWEDQMLVGMLGGALKAPGLMGVDRDRPILVHVFLPDVGKGAGPTDFMPSLVFVVPVENAGETYLAAFKQMSPNPVEVGDGLLQFPNIPGPVPTAQSGTYVGIVGENAVVGDRQDIVKSMTVQVAESADAASCLLNLPGALRVGLDIQECLPPVEVGIQIALAAMQEKPMPPEMPMNPIAILKAEAEALVALMHQLEAITIGIMPRKRTLDFYSRVDPVAGSATSRLIKKMQQPSLKYRNALPENAYFAAAGNGMDVFNELTEPYCKLMDGIYGGMGPQFTNTAPLLRKAMTDMKGLYAGDYAIGLVPGPDGAGVGFVEIIALTDVEKMKKVTDEMLVAWTETAMPGFSMEVGEPRTYEGLEILTYTYSVDPTAGQATPGMPITMPAWLDGIKGELTFTDSDIIYTIGRSEVMDMTIDRLKSVGTSIENTKTFRKLIPKLKHQPVAVYTLSLVKLAKALLSGPAPAEQLSAVPDDSDGIAGYVMVSGDNMVDIERVSLTEVAAIKSVVPVLQGMMMGMMMQGGMPGAPQMPPPAPAGE